MPALLSLFERLTEKITKQPDGCWEWDGCRNAKGYGVISIVDASVGTHKVAYELAYGKVPDGLCVLHRCDNPACVRPSHLFLGTKGDNNSDRASKGRNDDRRGANNTGAKLDEEKVKAIREMLKQGGRSQKSIGEAFGVCQAVVSSIQLGKSWTHVQ